MLPAIPCLMILICVFLSVPILPTSLAFSDYGIYRVAHTSGKLREFLRAEQK